MSFFVLFFVSTRSSHLYLFFFFNDTATTEIYTLSLHDALPIFFALGRLRNKRQELATSVKSGHVGQACRKLTVLLRQNRARSEEHTSELQSQSNLVCRLLLEKKKQTQDSVYMTQ